MYCGTNKTALASQRQIAEAFVNLLRENAYESISISKVCRAAGVSRQTFYTLFESKENIITYLLAASHLFAPASICCPHEMSLKDLSREYSTHITESKEILSLLAQNDVLYLMHDCLYESFISCNCLGPETSEVQRAFTAEFFAGGLSGIARTYVQQGGQMTVSQLDDMIYMLFSGQMLK